jgi:hypothetical protein
MAGPSRTTTLSAQAERIGGDLRHGRIGAGADVVGGGLDKRCAGGIERRSRSAGRLGAISSGPSPTAAALPDRRRPGHRALDGDAAPPREAADARDCIRQLLGRELRARSSA